VHSARLLITFLILFIIPSYAYANGGGPILLFINFAAFVLGQVWILSAETFMYCKMLKIKVGSAFIQVFKVNLVSTVLIGLGLPFLLAVITAFGMELPSPIGGVMSALGTWVYDSAPYIDYVWYITAIWFVVTLYLTVICERWYIQKLWAKTNFNAPINIDTFMWQVHFVSYTGLILAFVSYLVVNGL
jgi:hypothetical protein